MTAVFVSIVFFLLLVPVANISLIIAYFIITKKVCLKDLSSFILLFLLEIGLFIFMFTSPIRDGGVFMQAFLAEIAGIGALITQISTLVKVKRRIKNRET